MPTVQLFKDGETYTKQMPTPKRISVIQSWYNDARKAIPEIPPASYNVHVNNEWMIEHQEASTKWIKFDLLNRIGQKAYIVILR